ncbi:MAG: GNAT family N-acetyltransferase [Candidatus Dormibacteraeota bacterium]|nr:GNAT family N-acetyltransferase [Candidatus Dormibacteraeota bacterium]
MAGPPPDLPYAVTEIESALAAQAMGDEAELVPNRVARGSRCFGAWLGDELVGYGWLSAKPEWIGEIEREIAPAPGEAYIWNCVTFAPRRRKGVFRTLVASLVAYAKSEGLTRLWIATVSSLADSAISQANFVPVMRFDAASWFGLRWLKTVQVQGVDPGLSTAAQTAMAIEPGSSIRRSRPRRH